MSAWKQLLPGAIEPEAGVTYEFRDWVGQTFIGLFREVRPDPMSQTGGVILALADGDATVEEPRALPLWFREVIEG